MKNILLSAAAIAMIAGTPAFAATGGDGVGTYNIAGTASNFCKLGVATSATGTTAGTNVTIDATTRNSSGNNGVSSDALINITTLQDDGDHAKSWNAVMALGGSVCNTAYTVKASSANGGLAYKGTQRGTDSFTTKLAYSVKADFDTQIGVGALQASALQSTAGTLLTSNLATAGTFKMTFDGPADASKFLLSGSYSDQVVVTMAPTV